MVTVVLSPLFEHTVNKIKDGLLKERIGKQIKKIIENPGCGKPMRFASKNSREVYIPPFRLSYEYLKQEDKIIFLDLCPKDQQ